MIWAIFLLVSRSSETYIVRQGTLTQEDETVGYIIRDEKVEKGEDYENGIYEIATENQRVAVGDSIFRYYSDSEKKITEQVEEINKQIQEILEQENLKVYIG